MGKRRINYRHLAYVVFDIVATFTIVFFSFLTYIIRYGGGNVEQTIGMFVYCGAASIFTVIVFLFFNVYKIVTTNFSLYDAIKVAGLVLLIHLIGLVFLFALPEAVLKRPTFFAWVLSTLSLVFLIVGSRLGVRSLNALIRIRNKSKKTIRTLIIGAGQAAKIIFEETMSNKNNYHKVLLFVDDDPTKIGGYIASLPVKGPISQLEYFIDQFDIEEVIIAIPSLDKKVFEDLVLSLQKLDVRINCMPLLDQMNGPFEAKITRIDIDALLERSVIKLDNHEVNNMLHGQTVLVTGAGGSIGSELCRQILEGRPSKLILFDIYENSTYEIQQELKWLIQKRAITDVELVVLIGSTYDAKRIEKVIKEYHPDYIYHAAAYKHVPLMEDSPMEAIRTNVIGTYNVARLADKYKVKKMLLVSTDKAVRPTNTMGATKRFAEMIIQYFSTNAKNTKYCAVRFGNVLGSNGSVVPLFEKQIKEGGPLTVTDRNIIRYFMTIPEAVGLILNCSLLASDGELFILDMGTPVSIVSLAEKMIRQAGLVPYKDIDIVFTGLRPGEKLYEELLVDLSKQTKTSNGKIYIEKKGEPVDIPHELDVISKAFDLDNNIEIKKLLASIITTYTVKQ